MTSAIDPPSNTEASSATRRWRFFGESALPADPLARSHEKRGRKWLFVSYFLCPCHVPITLALLGALFGGTAIGASLSGNALRIGIVLTTLYAIVLWRGFRQIRRAKQIGPPAAGSTARCRGVARSPGRRTAAPRSRSESPEHTWPPAPTRPRSSRQSPPDDRRRPGDCSHVRQRMVGAQPRHNLRYRHARRWARQRDAFAALGRVQGASVILGRAREAMTKRSTPPAR